LIPDGLTRLTEGQATALAGFKGKSLLLRSLDEESKKKLEAYRKGKKYELEIACSFALLFSMA